jgi:hypothetical protein
MTYKLKYSCFVRPEHRLGQPYVDWLYSRCGVRDVDWTYFWEMGNLYKVTVSTQEDIIAFKLVFGDTIELNNVVE